jgi:hypothetical protein
VPAVTEGAIKPASVALFPWRADPIRVPARRREHLRQVMSAALQVKRTAVTSCVRLPIPEEEGVLQPFYHQLPYPVSCWLGRYSIRK